MHPVLRFRRRATAVTLGAAALAIGWSGLRTRLPSFRSYSTPNRATAGTVSANATTRPKSARSLAEERDRLVQLRDHLSSEPSAAALRKLLVGCTTTYPTLAIELAETWARNDRERFLLVSAVTAEWGRTAPCESWDWVRENSARLSLGDEPSLAAEFLQAIAATYPALVLDFARDALRDDDHDEAQRIADGAATALVSCGRVDLAQHAIAEWLRGKEADAIPASMIAIVTLGLASRDSMTSASTWLSQLPATAPSRPAFGALAAEWAEKNPRAALDWAQALSQEAGRSEATRRAFQVWVDHDPAAASSWFLQNEAKPEMDRLVPELIEEGRLSYTHPMAAMAWASLVRDAALRTQCYTVTFARWAEYDRAGALRYLDDSAALSPEEKARLVSVIDYHSSSGRSL